AFAFDKMALPLIRTLCADLHTARIVAAQDECFDHVEIEGSLHLAIMRNEVSRGAGSIAHDRCAIMLAATMLFQPKAAFFRHLPRGIKWGISQQILTAGSGNSVTACHGV